MIRIKTKSIIIAVVLSVVPFMLYLGYNHYSSVVEDLQISEADNATLTGAVEVQNSTIEAQAEGLLKWSLTAQEYEERIKLLSRSIDEARNENRKLNEIFSQHNLTKLAQKKPGLIQSRINSGTARMFDLLTCETTTPNQCGGDPDT